MTTPTPSSGAVTAPQIAVSIHAWEPYYKRSGGAEVMTDMFRAHLDALAKLNKITPNTVTRVRVDMGWSASQPTKSPPDVNSAYNKRFTKLFQELAGRGLLPYVVVHQSPPWARPQGAPVKCLPTDPQSIGPWAAWFATAYGKWVKEVQVWNEPNLAAFSGEGNNTPAKYTPLLKAFHTAAVAANPRLKIIGGNVSQNDWLWLRGCYAQGLGEHCDIIGIHPYQGNQSIHPASVDVSGLNKKVAGWEKGRITAGIPAIAEVMDSYGDTYKPIWACEVGWSASKTGVGTGDVGPGKKWATMNDKAAAYQSGLLTLLTDPPPSKGACAFKQVRLMTVYEAYDPLTSNPHQKGFEILEASGAHKAQARALAEFRKRYPKLRALY